MTTLRSYARPTGLAAACLIMASSAGAVTFDFAAVASGGPVTWDAVTGLGERGYGSFSMTVGGLTVTATASKVPIGPLPLPLGSPGHSGTGVLSPASSEAHVYLDGPVRDALGNPLVAGLGVCKTLGTVGGVADQCDPSSDDDVSSGELLTLTFSAPITLEGILFRNEDHETTFGGQFYLSIAGGSSGVHSLSHAFTPSSEWSGTVFTFAHETENFYIQSLNVRPVPEPATLGLLGSALLLAGLGARRRRR